MIHPQDASEFPGPARTKLLASSQFGCNAVWDSDPVSLALVKRVSRRQYLMETLAVAWKVDLRRRDYSLVFVCKRLSYHISRDEIAGVDEELTACAWSSRFGTVCLVLLLG